MKTKERLLPTQNCWVSYNNNGGVVLGTMEGADGISAKVRFKDSIERIVLIEELSSGFKVGMDVRHVPSRTGAQSLGEGVVLKTRTLGFNDQVLVEFTASGSTKWLPYETLSWIKGPKHRFILGDCGDHNSAERFRLKVLAHAIETWNENTGSLSRMDIDPLPHQTNLVHHILASGSLNWLIADDVGLGKTIETGMLIKALRQRGQARRILLITPAGLTAQWKEELHHKFALSEFEIYGENFSIDYAREWKKHDDVIGSIDRFKDEKHLEILLQAEPWDLVIFDEAHRLSRRQYGMKYDASQRFQLAQALRQKTQAFILLSATPHQGMQDKFQSLLTLLHPDRKNDIDTLALNPEILSDMMFRNNKADVTDIDGNFIFHGKSTKALRVPLGDDAKEFDQALQDYLKQGYAAGSALGFKGNAIGFVMTVYRKLAASSAQAIHTALLRRRDRLHGEYVNGITDLDTADERYYGEYEEKYDSQRQEFFEGELELLDRLIVRSERHLESDKKIQLFLDELISNILAQHSEEKVLIFTEYRSTQSYIKTALEKRYGESKVELINGSMRHQERRESIDRFENDGQFMISTEAGGEGINLQQNCHVMVNYDLPWNPMRIVQRIGRLYRYGQKKKVVVFNIHSPETADEQIMDMMYERIDQVVSDLATVGNEFNDTLQDDILGEIAEMVDVQKILEESTVIGIERTQERIDEAMEKAKEAASKQRELFEYAASFDPNEAREELGITSEHLESFILGMFELLAIEVVEKTHKGMVWQIRLPEELSEKLGVRKTRWEVTSDRLTAAHRPNTNMLDMDNFLMLHMIELAKSYEFMGQSAVAAAQDLSGYALVSGYLRWQNENGVRQRQEYAVWHIESDGRVTCNPSELSEWLKEKAITSGTAKDRKSNEQWFKAVDDAANIRLHDVSNKWLHPDSYQPIASAWLNRD
ncbi:DEAD/DEAH box helicase family protein [Amphritea atlantica]|nr:DEAD/DEAH box helicase family protein [Amphritea atlantica]